MFETPLDAWYVWLGTAVAAAGLLGVALALPTAAPPDVASAADTVDRVAGAPHNATGAHPLDAQAVKLSAHSVALRERGTEARERLSFGPVTPVPEGGKLATVLAGAPPSRTFESPSELARAARRARDDPAGWERADELRVRTIVWGDVHVTLVGA